VRGLAANDDLYLICGRYEGVDERVAAHLADREVSVGDYVLTGGELPAMVLIDAVGRLISGVLGSAESPKDESFAEKLLEYPHYTRPAVFEGYAVPEVLLSGHHAEIERWRRAQASERTRRRRPDLLEHLER
jgi:tRNA (guanine37-N1)-methyltransferase